MVAVDMPPRGAWKPTRAKLCAEDVGNAHLIALAPAMADEIVRLREALAFYADKSRYDNDTQVSRGDGTYDVSCSVLDDAGAIARAALGDQ